MPWSNDNGPKASGPWGGGGGRGGRNGGGGPWGGGGGGGGGRGPGGGGGGQGPNIDDFFKKGQSQLKNVLGEGGGGGFGFLLILLVAAGAWVYASVYTVKPEEQAAVLTFGEFTSVQGPGLNFAPWPVQTPVIRAVRRENNEEIGNVRNERIMLTGDENIAEVSFQVVWLISDLEKFLFNLSDPAATIRAVAESAMREVVGRSELLPLLNRDRSVLSNEVERIVQATLDEYQSGVQVIRVTLDTVDAPEQVRDAFRDVQAAEQERDRLQKEAEAYFNRRTAEARGKAQSILEAAEAYKARVVAEAEGQAARFVSVLGEFEQAEDVTRKRLYLETMEKVLGSMNKIILDQSEGGGNAVLPYLPLDQLQRGASPARRTQ